MLTFRQFIKENSDDVQIETSHRNNTITLHKIVVPKHLRGKGVGTQKMKELTKHADETGKRVVLTPTKDFGGSISRLKKFYKSHGFYENRGKKKDYSTRETMIREPQK
jgi:GNAT superfamily N-acetyltransferase